MKQMSLFVTMTAIVGFGILQYVTHPAVGTALDDQFAHRVRGTNGGQNGSGFYDCASAQAASAGANWYSTTDCNALHPMIFQPGLKCIDCGDNAFGRNMTSSGTPIVYNQNVSCSGTKQTGDCQKGASGYGVCNNMTPSGNCNQSFNQYSDQNP